MAKLIKKSKCTFEAGHIVKKNELVGIPYAVWAQLNKLELVVQQLNYLRDQPAFCAGPSLEGFERQSALANKRPYIDTPKMPVTDRRVAEAMEFMREVDSLNDAVHVNELIDEYGELIDWCDSDKFVEGDCCKPIDTWTLGNPLLLTGKEVAHIIQYLIENPVVVEG